MFKEMNGDGWDINAPLKWGFYFLDPDKSNLRLLYEHLKYDGYTLEEFSLIDDEKWRMSISKIEMLSPEKLYNINIEFKELTICYQVQVYEGWDVIKVTDEVI
jgi:hypothetical protein